MEAKLAFLGLVVLLQVHASVGIKCHQCFYIDYPEADSELKAAMLAAVTGTDSDCAKSGSALTEGLVATETCSGNNDACGATIFDVDIEFDATPGVKVSTRMLMYLRGCYDSSDLGAGGCRYDTEELAREVGLYDSFTDIDGKVASCGCNDADFCNTHSINASPVVISSLLTTVCLLALAVFFQ